MRVADAVRRRITGNHHATVATTAELEANPPRSLTKGEIARALRRGDPDA